MLAQTLHLSPPARPMGQVFGNITRDEVILGFVKLESRCHAAFRYKPTAVPFNPQMLKVSGKLRSSVENLVAWALLPKVGALVSGPKDTVNLEVFGDTIGLFLARVADLTHTPSAKFSPFLSGPGG